ncbi:MAG: ATP-binding protein [Geothrix sp.]|uniref:sensor histidine kinase n=1 Tax=Geothrix sp. TaxID=1962974 RepID=UPI003BB0275E
MTWPFMSLPRLLRSLLFGALLPMVAADGQAPGRYPGRTFGFPEGLTNTSVIALAQGADGLIYAGTEGGLFRFDGRRFEPLDLPPDHRFITTLLAGQDGRLWVGTRNGLGWLDAGWTFHAEGGPLAQRIHHLGLDAQGDLWVHAGTQLFVHSGGTFSLAPARPGPADLIQVFADPTATGVKVLGKQGIWTLDASRRAWALERMPAETGDIPLAFGWDGAGFTWMRTRLSFWRKAPGKAPWTRLGSPFSEAIPDHFGIARDRTGWLWINTAQGLLRCRGTETRPVATGPKGYVPVTGMLDAESSPWVASLGVTQVLGRGLWTLHDVEDGLPSNVVWTSLRDRQGRLWAATDGGLAVLGPAGWKVVAKGQFSRVRLHPDGTLLAVGSPGGTLYTIDPASLKVQSHASCMEPSGVSRGLGVEADGTVWISDYQHRLARGVKRSGGWAWEPGTLDGKPPEGIFEVVQDSTGAVYLPTKSTVYLRSGGTWESLGATLPYTPLSAQRMGDGDIWVAYLDRPVLTRHRHEGGTWKQVEEWSPFRDKGQLLVFSLAAAPSGRLWVGTSQGLGRLDAGTRTLEAWFAPGEGIPGADATTQGLLLEPNGDLWFGTTSGLGRYRTAEETKPPALVRPLLLGWSVHGKPLPLGGPEPRLGPRADLEARFALPSALSPSSLQLEARLSGVEQDWVRLDSNHLRYGALPEGSYQLEVRLRQEGGPPGPSTSLAFRVLPRWFETWWARLLFLLGASGAVYGAVLLRYRSLRRQNRILQETVDARTRDLREANEDLTQANQLKSRFLATTAHDLKNPLTGILLHAQLIQEEAWETSPDIEARARKLREIGQKMLQIINGLLDTAAQEARDVTLRLVESNIPSLVHQVVTTNLEYAASKAIRLTYREMLAGECWGHVDEVHFKRAVDNLVNNAIKYSPHGKEVLVMVTPRVEEGQGWVEIQVSDEGPGLSPEDKVQAFGLFQRLSAKPTGGEYSTGLGLSIVKQMVELHGGRVWIESESGQGATFRIEIPLRTGPNLDPAALPPPSPQPGDDWSV